MKPKYATDKDNRLVVKKGKKDLNACGSFSVDNKNRLIYFLNEPLSFRRINKLPSKIVFEGNWRLNDECDLEFEIVKAGKPTGERLLLKGKVCSTGGDSFIFEINSLDKQGRLQVYTLKLSGIWQADESNRLNFLVKKEDSPDILTLNAAWSVNKNQQITYIYSKQELKKQIKVSNVVTFDGFWQIDTSRRLRYVFSRSANSYFEFKVELMTPNLYPAKNIIKYRLGIGLRDSLQYKERILMFYGAWRFGRDFGLGFDMEYNKGRVRTISFNAQANITDKDKMIFILTDKEGRLAGISITLEHKFLKKNDADFFLKVKKALNDSRIEAGVKIPF